MSNAENAAIAADDLIVPKGYRMNAEGSLVPESKISDRDKRADKMCKALLKGANALQSQMRDFKHDSMAAVQGLVEASALEAGAKAMGGKKGNVTIVSFDGLIKVQRSIADEVVFDERLQAAKSLIDSCILRWSKGSNNNIKVLVNDAFQVDKEGNISVGKVLGLRRHKIEGKEWEQAMAAISNSVNVAGSKSYLRVYSRPSTDVEFTAVTLDLAKV